jgi:hypothetical protein
MYNINTYQYICVPYVLFRALFFALFVVDLIIGAYMYLRYVYYRS